MASKRKIYEVFEEIQINIEGEPEEPMNKRVSHGEEPMNKSVSHGNTSHASKAKHQTRSRISIITYSKDEVDAYQLGFVLSELARLKVPYVARFFFARNRSVVLNEDAKFFVDWLVEEKKIFRQKKIKNSWPFFVKKKIILNFGQYMKSLLTMHDQKFKFGGGINELLMTPQGLHLIPNENTVMVGGQVYQNWSSYESDDVDKFLDAFCTCIFFDTRRFTQFKDLTLSTISQAVLPIDIKQFLVTMLMVNRKSHASYVLLDHPLFHSASQKREASFKMCSSLFKPDLLHLLNFLVSKLRPDWKAEIDNPHIYLTLLFGKQDKEVLFTYDEYGIDLAQNNLFVDFVRLMHNCDKHYVHNKNNNLKVEAEKEAKQEGTTVIVKRSKDSTDDVTNIVDLEFGCGHGFVRQIMLLAKEIIPGASRLLLLRTFKSS